MHMTEMTPEAIFLAEANIPAGQPIVMLNLLRYRQQAEYANQQVKPLSDVRQSPEICTRLRQGGLSQTRYAGAFPRCGPGRDRHQP